MLTAGLEADGARGAPRSGASTTTGGVERLREMLAGYRHRRRGVQKVRPTGLAPLDAVLPGGGLPAGAVTEILCGAPGAGALTLALRIAGWHGQAASPPGRADDGPDTRASQRPLARATRALIFVDTCGDFYPPAALALGIDPDRLWVIRPRGLEEALWAVDQALRCPVVGAVVAPLEEVDERASRRLQLAAEEGGGLGLLLRPARSGRKSFAAVRISIEPVKFDLSASARTGYASAAMGHRPRWVRIGLLKLREGMPVEPFLVDLNHATGAVPVFPESVDRSAPRSVRSLSA